MQTIHDIATLRRTLGEARRAGQRIGLAPTMGNLHRGHLALVAEARRRADLVVASIFVNPLQFGPDEDFASYPRTLDADRAALEDAGCDILFAPAAEAIYPRGTGASSTVHVPDVSEGLCGARRPGHFDGVSTVVSMLFNLVQPDLACFGEKDYQQLAVIRRMVADLHFPVEIVGVPIVRAEDGLALSSRNGYLSAEQRARAPRLQAVLAATREALAGGEAPDAALREGLVRLTEAGFKPDYLELRRADDLGPVTDVTREAVLLAAAHLGPARLIDNLPVTLPR
ncbi:pantoate--beta-alanine ligase [Modicisalibacter tunisiensis]|uniref:Pantothenate synthetase n=1 Tax=Modicisalibacter tunisiensis TaxID=390637 RepID=A0ABS7WVA1_9GAMM|nr:pantoate--beta-alanine ligase [Modicisalibacter tunisiensis]MBZ9540066.1 pantoate--beta-alanine ligase [Modicisalibacter tunisiensis]MBZ9566540.1 pantoate--beta-alanine ligase [Modicisalibacter tunisiensis]